MAEATPRGPSLMAPLRHVARLTLETVTPLSVASGQPSDDLDTPLFRDWNGLPCLSGAGVAGVLRALWRDVHPNEPLGAVFGVEEATRDGGAASRLLVSFGLAQDGKGCARCGLADVGALNDPVLNLLLRDAPIQRDGVAIDPHGVAVDHAKFERALCPVGTRFSLDLSLDGWEEEAAADRARLLKVVALIEAPHARFGGAGRRGLGRIRIVRERSAVVRLDRHGPAGRDRWIAFRALAPHQIPAMLDALGAPAFDPLPKFESVGGAVTATLQLKADEFWRMGQGRTRWTAGDRKVSRMPPAEPLILWNDRHEAEPVLQQTAPSVAPVFGASIKGALAHRAEFHLRRIRFDFCDADPTRGMDDLFGSVADKGAGRAGRVFIDDTTVTTTAGARTRNSLDRHTGGGRDGKLFTDEALWRGDVTLSIAVRRPEGVDVDVLRAFDWALEDLREGRLAVGAGDAIGDGVLRGEPVLWSNGGAALADAGRTAAGPGLEEGGG